MQLELPARVAPHERHAVREYARLQTDTQTDRQAGVHKVSTHTRIIRTTHADIQRHSAPHTIRNKQDRQDTYTHIERQIDTDTDTDST